MLNIAIAIILSVASVFTVGQVFAGQGHNHDNVAGHECEQGAHTHNPHCQPTPIETPCPTRSATANATPELTPTVMVTTSMSVPTLTPEATPGLTATTEPTTPPAGHGDGLSDGKSDGRSDGLHTAGDGLGCSTHECKAETPLGAPNTGRGK